jgi:hypothetical protein
VVIFPVFPINWLMLVTVSISKVPDVSEYRVAEAQVA